ncbi:MAG: 50S ribosomal protein L13 [Candidatus Ryanbacteria bacterium RIFCSPLOWO2_01_FULL_48_26]|uniref:Large ribosomal subunit protein uL13 n=1 Tax=Candidatus Ryanbacteria bacterium RIFCSPLOWO2_01_FULL_48_26 TaxID=1802126 RepID=A0A1G2GWA1_9BACT|nr:MAG: 50S ribosomal protein L13 [Candidatus Ryanbacteria bacterium RIFCSPLOWO2_01_FULL_48_26]
MDYHIDAKNKIMGRLASEIAQILQGKKSASYNPRISGGDKVFVKNYANVSFTGRKMKDKIYYKHTGYMGHLREKTLEQVHEKDPRRILREAVRRMLPKNFLNAKRLKNLIFIDGEK